MANSNAPTGIKPVQMNGTPWNGQGLLVAFAAGDNNNIFVGDPVRYATGGGTDALGVPVVTIASAGATNPILGSFLGVCNGPAGSGFTLTRDLPIYRQASIANYGFIATDPNLVWEVQEDSVGGAIVAATSAGELCDLVAGAGSTFTGMSGWQLDSSTAGAGTTKQVKILELARGPDNAIGVNAKWRVRLNLAQLWSNVAA